MQQRSSLPHVGYDDSCLSSFKVSFVAVLSVPKMCQD